MILIPYGDVRKVTIDRKPPTLTNALTCSPGGAHHHHYGHQSGR